MSGFHVYSSRLFVNMVGYSIHGNLRGNKKDLHQSEKNRSVRAGLLVSIHKNSHVIRQSAADLIIEGLLIFINPTSASICIDYG